MVNIDGIWNEVEVLRDFLLGRIFPLGLEIIRPKAIGVIIDVLHAVELVRILAIHFLGTLNFEICLLLVDLRGGGR